jgi:hypothetical protein
MSIYVTYIVQILLIIHVLKTGRERYWIWLLIFLPLIGGIAYVAVEILPELTGGISGQRARRGVRKALDPGAEIRESAAAWEHSPNADNARRYAQALIEADKSDEALDVLDSAQSGFFKTEPALMLLRAQAQQSGGSWAAARQTLESLRAHNSDFRSASGHLLYARALEETGDTDRAIAEYQTVSGYFPGAEARYRYALALKNAGRATVSADEFRSLIQDADLAPPHFRKNEKSWLKAAAGELAELDRNSGPPERSE